ncbi:MAG: hypothetical protein OXU75_00685 [Deltaproteobacteria bacterium]|nr:hypothetical protein [Deltaproteobacteria bacterium]
MASSSEAAAWDTFVRRPGDLRCGVKAPLVLRDLRPGRGKYALRHVVGIVRDGDGHGDSLVIRTVVGVELPGAYTVEIVREMPQEIAGTPYQDFYAALQRAAGTEPPDQ